MRRSQSFVVREPALYGNERLQRDSRDRIICPRKGGRWVARSFNDRYQDVPLENGAPVRVLGRVVWAGVRLA